MELNQYQQEMLEGKHGRGVQKAMEILHAMGEARDAEKMVEISYAHLMPPDVMFFPYGRQGKWGQELMRDLILDIKQLKVPATIEPKFVDLNIAKQLEFSDRWSKSG